MESYFSVQIRTPGWKLEWLQVTRFDNRAKRISTAFMESAVNQLIDKRMSKSQQMRWSPMGAYLLLQVRADLVDGRLGDTFARWYPDLTAKNQLYQVAIDPTK